MGNMLTNQINGCVSLLSMVAAMTMLPAAAMAQDMAADDEQAGRTRRSEDIVVTGRSLSQPDVPTATPVYVLSGDELAHRRQGGLGETLEGLPGVHLDSFGGGASRPVIRGQTTPRIEILTDGANLFDVSSLSPDHAIATDPLLLDGIEVLRGAAATRYGGNAMFGAVNLIDSRVPKAIPEGGYSGAVEARYGTGDNEKTVVGRVTAALGSSFAVHAEGSSHHSDDYAVPKSFGSSKLKDSFANGSSYSLGASWITSKGYLGVAYTWQENEYGLPGHSHEGTGCHAHITYLHCGDPPPNMPGYDDSHTASIRLRSGRFDVRGDYDDLLPGIAHTRLRLSHTDYVHDELDGSILFSHFTNKVYDGRLELTHKPLFGFTGTLGVQYTHGAFSGLDTDKLYTGIKTVELFTTNTGVFLSERRSFGAFDLEVSARKDWRKINSPFRKEYYYTPELLATMTPAELDFSLGANEVAHADTWPTTKASPFSVAIAGTWNIGDSYSLALQLSRSQRAPSVREIYARTNNLATNSTEEGLLRDSYLSPGSYPNTIETAKAINLTLRKSAGATQFEVGVFHQDIDNYVFARLLDDVALDSGAHFRYLIYRPAHVTFTGIDGQISRQFTPSSRVVVFGDYVRATLEFGEDRGLPRMPPGRLGARYEGNWGPFSADLEYSRTFAQNRVATTKTPAYIPNRPTYGGQTIREEPTAGYNMLNATLAYRLKSGTEIYLRGSNLTNELAYSHSSFVKNQSPLRGRNIVFGIRQEFNGAGAPFPQSPFNLDSSTGRVDWTGAYAGLHLGYGFGRTTGTTTALDGTPDAIAATESTDQRFKRLFPGVQTGFNYQFGNGIVLGVEADWSLTNLSGSQKAFSTEGPFAGTDALQAENHYNIRWTAALKGRVGYAAGRWLPYIAGGIALAGETQKRDRYFSTAPDYPDLTYGSVTVLADGGETARLTRIGGNIGGGIEYALSSRLSIKGEYAYNRFGRTDFEFPNARAGVGRDYRGIIGYGTIPPALGPTSPLCKRATPAPACFPREGPIMGTIAGGSNVVNGRRASNSLDFQTFKFGVNYRF